MSEKKETVGVGINVPLTIYLYGRRPLQETKDVVVEHLRIQAAELFKFISYGSSMAQNNDIEKIEYISLCGTLGHLGEGLMHAIEIAQDDLGGEMAKASLPEKTEVSE